MKKLISMLLATIMAVSVMAVPAFAAQSYEIEDNIYPFYQMPANDYLAKITANEVKKAGTVDIALNYIGEVDVYRCKGNVTLEIADCVISYGLADSFTYAESLDSLVNNPYQEWVSLGSGTFTKPGAYLFVRTVMDKGGAPLPAKVSFVFVIEEGTSTPVYELKSFKDVPASRWSHDAIMEMVDLGMFAGTKSPDKNGVGEFNPTGIMTKAQFITVMTRYLYNSELEGMATGAYWYSNNYDVAVKHGIITKNEFSIDDMAEPITRQEMALIAVRAAEAKNAEMSEKADKSDIADFNTIDTYYQDFVRQAFSMGLISGYDDKGTFGPKDTLTREQGAMVAYRIVNLKSVADKPVEEDNNGGVEITLSNGSTVVIP